MTIQTTRVGNGSQAILLQVWKGNETMTLGLDYPKWKNNRNQRRYNKFQREKVLRVLGSKCARCGESDPRCLQIDHINGNGEKDRGSKRGARYHKRVYWSILRGSKDYQLLCANCNWKKKYDKQENPNLLKEMNHHLIN